MFEHIKITQTDIYLSFLVVVTEAHRPLFLTRFGRIIIFFFCFVYCSNSIVEKLTHARCTGYFFTIWLSLMCNFSLIMLVITGCSRASVRVHRFFSFFSIAFFRFVLESVLEVFLRPDFLFYMPKQPKIGIFKNGKGCFSLFLDWLVSDRNRSGSALLFCWTKKLCWVLAQASTSDTFNNLSLR